MQYPNEQESDKLIFHLRHSGEPEESSVTTTSLDGYNWGFPYVYMKSFDLQPYIQTGVDPLTIEVHTKVNTTNNLLENATDKVYSVVYKTTSTN